MSGSGRAGTKSGMDSHMWVLEDEQLKPARERIDEAQRTTKQLSRADHGDGDDHHRHRQPHIAEHWCMKSRLFSRVLAFT
jgi:hypothetical protein